VPISELWGKKKIGCVRARWSAAAARARSSLTRSTLRPTSRPRRLYFSAHWCPPCKAFTPKLIDAYKALRAAGRADFEFVFVSSDKSAAEFGDYFKTMPWLGIPPNDPRKAKLSAHFGVQGIPTFVMLDEHGVVINANARGAVVSDPSCARFPWAPPAVADLEEPEGINSTPSVVAFLDGLDAPAQAAALAALTLVAQPYVERARASGGEDAPAFLFFAATSAEGNVAPQVRKLAGLEAEAVAGIATLILLDLDDDGALYKSDATAVDAHSLGALLAGYEAKTLPRAQIQPPN
jgi:nucleoredoxin